VVLGTFLAYNVEESSLAGGIYLKRCTPLYVRMLTERSGV
jgi:hypothetical protein